ncbi:IclR family transcriptional regulator [Breoghania corrubedonensis]|uniref:IclR family transcriptional regulator n=1 Tax=Breoghania corrubedonensis TaxID=665038 RepID=A0A2T5VC85_9HYPH|nr:IclR family transcriptional regulator [Breoghania corrubedonensis]PTW61369.1 IclR family transcriptional regulator [Breoghania corrubedonensis]
MAEEKISGAQSVDRALGLLAIVRRNAARGISLSGLMAESGLNKPTTRRLMLALIRAGLVEQDDLTRDYHLGEEAFVMGALATGRHGLLEITGESLRRLADLSGDTAFFSVMRRGYSVCLQREEGNFPIRTHVLQAGAQHPLGVGAGSAALLAELPDEEIEHVLSENAAALVADFPAYTPEVIWNQIRQTRAQGHSLNPGLVLANSWAVGLAVRYPDGRLAGALSVAAIDSRMGPDRQEQIVAWLRAEERNIAQKLERMFAPRGASAGMGSGRRSA